MAKKILMVTENFYPEIGSAGNRAKNIYKLLTKKEHEVQVLTTDPTYPNRTIYEDDSLWNDEQLTDASTVDRVKIKNREYTSSIFNRINYYLKVAFKMLFLILFDKRKYDVVYTSSPPIFVAMIGLVGKYKYRARFILDVRDLWPESLKGVGVFDYKIVIWFFSKVEKMLYKKADEIIVNSEGFIDYIEKIVPHKKECITYIPNSANLKELSMIEEVVREKSDTLRAIYAGNIGLAHDYEMLRDISLSLHENNISFTIVGYGARCQELKTFVEENKLTNVQFLHPMTRRACLRIMAAHDIAIATLKDKKVFETVLPGRIVDYMTCGVPIIGSVSGIAKQMIEDHYTGFVIPNNDVEQMVEMIQEVKEDRSILKEMSMNAMNVVREEFLWDTNIVKFERLIDDKGKAG